MPVLAEKKTQQKKKCQYWQKKNRQYWQKMLEMCSCDGGLRHPQTTFSARKPNFFFFFFLILTKQYLFLFLVFLNFMK